MAACSGVHVAAVQRNPQTYEHIDPELVAAVHGEGFEIAIESNGTIAAHPRIEYVIDAELAGEEAVRAAYRMAIAQPLTVQDLAAAVHCSPPTLFRLCRRALGLETRREHRTLVFARFARLLELGDELDALADEFGIQRRRHLAQSGDQFSCVITNQAGSVTSGAATFTEDANGNRTGVGGVAIATYDDHRVAMCFSLAAFNPARQPVRILDPKCVAKTFPDYFEALFSVAAPVEGTVPVLCVDGPTASGKGTLASRLAERLGYHLLDSGALYRVTALAALRAGLALEPDHEAAIAALAERLPVRFVGEQVLLAGEDVSEAIRSEEGGMNASKVSALPAVRTALVALQHSFARLPGLVADGRDMGTVIFPLAPLKVFLTASAAMRAQRRYKQLISKGIPAILDTLRADLEARDARDMSRSVAPLKPAEDARLLDNSDLSIEKSVDLVLNWWQGTQPFGSV